MSMVDINLGISVCIGSGIKNGFCDSESRTDAGSTTKAPTAPVGSLLAHSTSSAHISYR